MCAFAFVFNSFCSENALNNWFRVVVVVAVCPRKLVIVTCHLNDDQTRSRIQHFKQHLQAFLPPLRKQCAIFVKRHHIWRNAVTANVWKLTASTAFFGPLCVCVCVYFLLLLQCRTADEFGQREQNIRMQQHYWHCSFDLIYLWTDNMHILYHLCMQTECTNCKMSAKGMSNGNGKREKQQN